MAHSDVTPIRLVLVVACALVDVDKRLLIAQRPHGKTLAGLWEFPGGKVEQDESIVECAVREALEEVALDVTVIRRMLPVVHVYLERTVCLNPVLCQAVGDDAMPLASQEVAWVHYLELSDIAFPDANRAIVEELIKELEARP